MEFPDWVRVKKSMLWSVINFSQQSLSTMLFQFLPKILYRQSGIVPRPCIKAFVRRPRYGFPRLRLSCQSCGPNILSAMSVQSVNKCLLLCVWLSNNPANNQLWEYPPQYFQTGRPISRELPENIPKHSISMQETVV